MMMIMIWTSMGLGKVLDRMCKLQSVKISRLMFVTNSVHEKVTSKCGTVSSSVLLTIE